MKASQLRNYIDETQLVLTSTYYNGIFSTIIQQNCLAISTSWIGNFEKFDLLEGLTQNHSRPKQNERRIKQRYSEFLSSISARKLLEHIPNLMFGICCITWKTTVVKSVVYTCLDIEIDEPLSCNIQLIMQTLITRVFFKKSISRRLSRKNRELS